MYMFISSSAIFKSMRLKIIINPHARKYFIGMGLGFLLLVTYTDYWTVISQQQLKYQSVVKRWSMEVTYWTFWQLLYQSTLMSFEIIVKLLMSPDCYLPSLMEIKINRRKQWCGFQVHLVIISQMSFDKCM